MSSRRTGYGALETGRSKIPEATAPSYQSGKEIMSRAFPFLIKRAALWSAAIE
jgi:hypothetical protein